MKNAIKKLANPKSYIRAYGHTRRFGRRFIKDTWQNRSIPDYVTYNNWYDQVKPTNDELESQRAYKFKYQPKISIVTPVYNPLAHFLREMLDSVVCQTYSNWEFCIANASDSSEVATNKITLARDIKETLQEYANKDKRIKVVNVKENLGIAGNTNAALEMATGDYIAFMDHDDILPCHALYEVVSALQESKHDILYSDEDYVNEDLKYKFSPQFKPDWSPHLLESHNYITHFFIVKKTLADNVGKLNSKYDGAQDYDFVLRCTDASKDIFHIPKILYHWRAHQGSVAGDAQSKMYAYDAGKAALEAHYKRRKIDAKVEHGNLLGYYHSTYPAQGNPLVSIIIPNKDHVDDLGKCINSIYEKSTYSNFEIIVAENNSEDKATFKFYDELMHARNNIKIVYYKGEFNYSAINNFAVRSAKGEYLLFLNNDTELITEDAISQMLGCCMLPEVGAVGAKLLYEDDTVQHAGIVLGFGGFAGHVYHGIGKDDPGYANKAQLSYDCSAVTGACLMTPKDVFYDINGFSENFKVAINDVDLCLKIQKLGYYVVCDNFALWHHYESKSRGFDEKSLQLKKRLENEKRLFQKRWAKTLENKDPFYNKNFSLSAPVYGLRKLFDIRRNIDSCKLHKHDNGSITVQIGGFCLSETNKTVKIKIFINGRQIDVPIKRVNRPDLFNVCISDKLNNKEGFIIKTDISKDDTLKIVFDADDTQKIHVYKFKDLVELSEMFSQPSVEDQHYQKQYEIWYKHNKPSQEELEQQKQTKFSINPKFSFVIPLYKTPERYLHALIDSIQSQTYSNWEICFSDGGGQDNNIKNLVDKYADKDHRIRYVCGDAQLGISENTNQALKIVTGDYVVFGDHDDLFEPNALFECVKVLEADSSVQMIYSDEDKIDDNGDKHFWAHFKPDFNFDMIRAENYICHMCVVSKSLQQKVGLLNSEYDGAQDYDFVLRCAEKTKSIKHIPKVLYNWRASESSTSMSADNKNYAHANGVKALQAHLDRTCNNAVAHKTKISGIYKVKYDIPSKSCVSIVVPALNGFEPVKYCIDSFKQSSCINYDFIIVTPSSCDFSEHKEWVRNAQKQVDIKIVNSNKETLSKYKAYNIGAEQSDNDYLLFLNCNLVLMSPRGIEELLMHCARQDVGAVCAKILTEADTIRHAGYIIGIKNSVGNNFYDFYKEEHGYFCRLKVVHDLSAVSSDCMMVKRELFKQYDGFDMRYKNWFADIDFCLRVNQDSKSVVFNPDAKFMYCNYQNLSADDNMHQTDTFSIKDTYNDDLQILKKDWQLYFKNGDPFYSPNLTKESTDFSLDVKASSNTNQ